jgi:hypothetical protein
MATVAYSRVHVINRTCRQFERSRDNPGHQQQQLRRFGRQRSQRAGCSRNQSSHCRGVSNSLFRFSICPTITFIGAARSCHHSQHAARRRWWRHHKSVFGSRFNRGWGRGIGVCACVYRHFVCSRQVAGDILLCDAGVTRKACSKFDMLLQSIERLGWFISGGSDGYLR